MHDKYVILDRDGVINIDSNNYIKSPDEWHPMEGSLDAIVALNNADYKVVLITNQSGIARGFLTKDILNAIHEKMQKVLLERGGKIFDIFYCPHHPDDGCECRKPKPGLLLKFANKYGVDLRKVCMVGDRIKDIQAAKAAGAIPHIVMTHSENKKDQKELEKVKKHKNLQAFVKYLLAK